MPLNNSPTRSQSTGLLPQQVHTVFRLIGDVAALRQDNQRLHNEVVSLSLKLDTAIGANKELAQKLDQVINAFMLHQGRTAIALGHPPSPVALRVQDRAHFGTSVQPHQVRTRSAPVVHGKALFRELEESESES